MNKQTGNDTFYDVHIHAMNMSHPNILAFVNRITEKWGIRGGLSRLIVIMVRMAATVILLLWLLTRIVDLSLVIIILTLAILLFAGPLVSSISGFMNSRLKSVKNLLAVMENDPGSFFQLMEECVKHNNVLFKNGELDIGGKTYKRFVLTPLIMDFGYKNIKSGDEFHYGKNKLHSGWGKPVKEQIIDLFNGIKSYRKHHETNGTVPLFEIYPFMGINTENYELNKIEEMLNKYFADYRGLEKAKYTRAISELTVDIEEIKQYCFAGIKLYPPLGFDPWPDDPARRQKVEMIYSFCCDKQIPVTAHCNPGGFRVISPKESDKYTSPFRWEKVLANADHSKLKLNFAHFGCQLEKLSDRKWFEKIIELILNYDNVYADISFCGIEPRFYGFLKKELDKSGMENKQKIMGRILFGSDFMINLLKAESYHEYLDIFSRDKNFSPEEKHLFCSINPQRFLSCYAC